MSSEHMMKVSTSLLLCNISAIQEMCSLASPDAIIPIRFIYLCVLNCITCINKNKHTVYGSRSMSDEGRTTVTVTYSIGHSTFQADWEKPEKCRTHGCMLHASISSSNTSINFSNVPFRKLWIEDPWWWSWRKTMVSRALLSPSHGYLVLYSLRASCCLRRGECHDLGLRPCKGEQLGLRALVVGPYEPV